MASDGPSTPRWWTITTTITPESLFGPASNPPCFPLPPSGYVFQGDAGVKPFGTTKYDHFGPRIGFAFSPDWGRLTGAPARRAFARVTAFISTASAAKRPLQTAGSPPFAGVLVRHWRRRRLAKLRKSFLGIGAGNGKCVSAVSIPNKFPYAPSGTPDFSVLEPLDISVYDPHITIPYSENYNVTIQRQLDADDVLSLGYVGAQGRHLLQTSSSTLELTRRAAQPTPCAFPIARSSRSTSPGNLQISR